MDLGLDGKSAIVTGASKGIGKAIAEGVAAVVAFLANDVASYVTGSTYRIDGGTIPSIDV